MEVQSKCGIRVTDGVGEVLNGMMGSNMRHLVKVLMQLENLAQIKFQKKGFVITIIHCYVNKESFLCIEQFVFAMNLMHWYFEIWFKVLSYFALHHTSPSKKAWYGCIQKFRPLVCLNWWWFDFPLPTDNSATPGFCIALVLAIAVLSIIIHSVTIILYSTQWLQSQYARPNDP